MKKVIIGILALVSLSAMAKPCNLEVIENIADGQVGVKYKEVFKKAMDAQKAGDLVLYEKKSEQANKIMTQVIDLATTACE